MEVIFSFSCSTKAAGQGQGKSRKEALPLLLIEKVSTYDVLLPGPRKRARTAHLTRGRTQESPMPRTREADAIERAFAHAWIVDAMIPDEEREARMHAFRQWWGSFEIDAFKHALHEGNEADRLVALFALGYLAYEEAHELLVPFLVSAVRKERGARGRVLGAHQDERAFALRGQLLRDQLDPFSPTADEQKVMNMFFQAERREKDLYGGPAAWKRLVHPGLV